MEIIQYTPDILTPVTEFYNRITADVPHCYPVKEDEFALATCGLTHQTNDTDYDLDSETAFVAMESGVVQAFIHVGFYQEENENNEKVNNGVIRFFGYKRGMRQAGQTVLEKAEEYLKSHNVLHVIAFSKLFRYRIYHFEYAHLSDTLDHVQALLGANGYRRDHGQVFLDWKNFAVIPMPSNLPVTFSVEWKEGRGKLSNCNITAHQDGEQVGVCWSVSGGEFSSYPEAQNWVYTDWIEVEDDFQGQGIGKLLLQSSLQEMHKVGYRHAALSTDWNNYRALLFYSNCGYRVVDWTYAYVKDFSEASNHK